MPGPFEGNETISLTGIDTAGEIVLRLPDVRVWSLVRHQSGEMAPAPCQLDTVRLDLASADPADWRASMVWRAAISFQDPVRVVEIRMAMPESTAATSPEPSVSWQT